MRSTVQPVETTSGEGTQAVPGVRVEVYVKPGDAKRALRQEVLQGLCGSPKELSPRWLYDERGSQLFDDITRLPEYYPTRREREILLAHAGDVARLSGATTLIELGSGTSEKTRLLLDAMEEAGQLSRFVPFDVSEAFLRRAAASLAREYPGITVHAVVGDFEHHLSRLPGGGRRLVAFLGGTIGNLKPTERARFLRELSSGLQPGDGLLLGTDLIKDRARLFAAYNDSAGVTAEFNRNVLRVLNRELGADFDPEAFEHVAPFDEHNAWVEMRLVSQRTQSVWLSSLKRRVDFAEGEVLRTEVSCKFEQARVEAELDAAGLGLAAWWTDGAGDFALSLALKRG
ncbi:L-histidine N(alpha)-methyltransferase [Myxococcus llanfairpwllgwyngyllgogerychwyrndrobwllllantysiliogogogochensis]|uniref:L-histidine N(Alpha)-methyltransferase n=1 Tax=Myxococcus llanfairpwllgwyngyllgogerychwyrndrobwllllantysiliogogogochensis TaxID=2590453 RepID=A0A540X3N3_9BACT|nr:L-histidine N(alpha)-methyltransferase [Myxococcus llanfairpwllgwyngyllgogerychwyrndrobwllllantysiliogogogochensis]TQF15840.1 L-histidine N(alpha)-methyltransferase [Myxococcus llanfairpwllgwyngyllgogerychwyrndrobwllllantysiliogogogochensis]